MNSSSKSNAPHYNVVVQQEVASLAMNEDGQGDVLVDASTPSSVVSTITIEDSIEQLGMGPFQYIILIAAGLCFAADAMEIVLLSFLSVVLQAEWQLSPNETASITSVLFFGACFGTLLLGPLADTWGRRPVFLCTVWIICIASLVSACMSHYRWLLGAIFIIGFGIGGLTVPFDILAEFLPSARRGSNLLMIEYCWTVGVLLVVLLAQLTLSHDDDGTNNGNSNNHSNNWRALVLGCASVCCGTAVLGTCLVPESPRWLVTQGRSKEALRILQRAAIRNGLVDHHTLAGIHRHPDENDINNDNIINDEIHPLYILFLPHVQLIESSEDATDHIEKSSFAELFQPRWRRITLFLWGTWAAFAFGYYGSIQAMTRVFSHDSATAITNTTALHNITTNNNHTSSVHFDYGALWISSSAEFVGTTLAVFSVDRVGRIPFQMVSYATAGIAICLLCVVSQSSSLPSILGSWISSPSSSVDYRRWTLIGLGFITRVFEMSATCVTWVSTAEILTTEVRTTGHAAANAVARLGALLSPFLIEGSTSSLSLWQIGIVMLLVHGVAVLCVSQLPETKGRQLGLADTNEIMPNVPAPRHQMAVREICEDDYAHNGIANHDDPVYT